MFYSRVIRQAVGSGTLSPAQNTLVVCGGLADREALQAAGFESVTISNLDRRTVDDCTPYRWDFQDAEHLTYADDSFDVAIVSAGLHHCHSPHRALLEMYRVARKAVLVIEARDSFLMRTAVKLGFTVDYELEAVSDEGFETGGVANGPVPNFIYRWTEREVFKVIQSFAPERRPDIRFFYGLQIPYERLARTNRVFHRVLAALLDVGLRIFTVVLPSQGNGFAFLIRKNDALQPWMERNERGLRLKPDWARMHGRLYQRKDGPNASVRKEAGPTLDAVEPPAREK